MSNDPEYSVAHGVGILLETYAMEIGACMISIPIGYHWNGSNIPRWIRWLFGDPFDAIHATPSLKHDRTYEVGCMHGVTRRDADRAYRIDIELRGQPRLLAWLEWANIRIFGRKYWKDF